MWQIIPSIRILSIDQLTTVARDRDNLFIYGPSGCGKSRTIVEIISKLSKSSGIQNVYVVNPRNAIGVEYGMISLYGLINKFGEKDVVIWDNFPDGIIQRDIASAMRVLEIVSSRRTMKLLIALKPKYLEAYAELVSSIMPEFSAYYVKYDRGKNRNILKSYGTISSTQYRRLYENYITHEMDTISQILWQKDPTPLTVLDYYKDLTTKENEVLASKAMILSRGYLKKSFRHLITGLVQITKRLRRGRICKNAII